MQSDPTTPDTPSDEPDPENGETTSPDGNTTNPEVDEETKNPDATNPDADTENGETTSPDGENTNTDTEEVEEPQEPVIPKPEDLTVDSEELRYVGWNIPKECNKIEVGSIIAMFCPDLRYLMHTQQVIDKTFEKAENYIE